MVNSGESRNRIEARSSKWRALNDSRFFATSTPVDTVHDKESRAAASKEKRKMSKCLMSNDD
jgi:hypothetical protein